MAKKSKSTNEDLTPEQQRYYRKVLMEEMIRKIERRIDNEDPDVMKSIKTIMDQVPIETSPPKEKVKKL